MVQPASDMGQNSSLPKTGRRKSLRSFVRRSSSNSRNLSHTFALNDDDNRYELLNVNLATEEELMTLPGVNREIAKSIVEHRKAIGRFRKVEDLALVNGIGADRLQSIRPEICVSSRRNQSGASSRAQSYDSLKSNDSRTTLRSQKPININKASVFELQCVNGITQEIAAAIVHHRTKKGPFKHVEDLRRLKTIDHIRLDNISRFLTVESLPTDQDNTDAPRPSIITNGISNNSTYERTKCNGYLPSKLPVRNGLSTSSLHDIFELLSAYSPRPIIEEHFTYRRNGEAAIRIATWNLHQFSLDKSNNLGVKEVVCRTILENGWSIVAVQDVIDVTSLKIICEELNKPTLRRVCEWKDKNHSWNFCMLDVADSHLGFIYDADGVNYIELISLNPGPDELRNDCEVLIASFRLMEELDLQLVNIKLNKSAKFNILNDRIKDFISEKDYLFVLTDFSEISSVGDDWLNMGGLQSVFPINVNTSYVSTKFEHTTNILFNGRVQELATGINGIVRQGLCHLAIPNCWNWGGPVSPFCPIWTEIFLNGSTGTPL